MRLNDERCLDSDELAAFLVGGLDAAATATLEAHVARCAPCRELLSALAKSGSLDGAAFPLPSHASSVATAGAAAPAPDVLVPVGARVGRYLVLGCLGAGGMGVVYAAHDPELNRKVALKLLRNRALDAAERGALRDRLLREAQAMAQLAHPHVVVVHDVGSFGEQIFIAMELVEGQTLAQWLAAAPRGWREVVAMFRAAGQGLAAAHAAGLVHRDFKPENVLVGGDGRVRVTDFGLARSALAAADATGAEATAAATDTAAARAPRTSAMTVTGALVGTPYYMAPEQYLGEPTDARSDQFSFCVALYAALAGEHPYAGRSFAGLAHAVTAGALRPPPRRDPMPRWLRRVLARGLASDRAQRFGSMQELLAALASDPTRRLWRALAIAAALLLLTAGLVGYRRHATELQCSGAERKLGGVWNARVRGDVERAFAATRAPGAAAAFATVAAGLDGYAQKWVALQTSACEAALAHDPLAEQRAACLDVHLRNVRALTERFTAADAATVAEAQRAVDSLGTLADCDDARAVEACGRNMDEFDWCVVGHEGKGDESQQEGLTHFRGRTFQLRAKHYAGEDEGNIAQGYRPGDQVWVDVSRDRGKSWVRCGPYSSDRTMWVPHRGKWLRVCVRADGQTQCATNGDVQGDDGSLWWSYREGPC